MLELTLPVKVIVSDVASPNVRLPLKVALPVTARVEDSVVAPLSVLAPVPVEKVVAPV
jgi:hypothetical protein